MWKRGISEEGIENISKIGQGLSPLTENKEYYTMTTQIDRINKVAKMVGKRGQMDSPTKDSITLYKPSGEEAGDWTWQEVKNWAEGNVSANTFDDWLWKAKEAFDAGDGETLGNMIFEIIYKYSKKLKAQAETGTFTFNVAPSNDPGAVGGSDIVTVIVDSGNPGGDPGEFEMYMKKVLSDWYDSEVN